MTIYFTEEASGAEVMLVLVDVEKTHGVWQE
jgi:hypothetical protein